MRSARNFAPLALAIPAIVCASPAMSETRETNKRTVVIEQTRLKARPGERADLASFIIANWFAMDRKAVEQGLFTSYRLIENPVADGAWDLLVEVGYPTAAGYDDPATQAGFAAIRARHEQVRINGKLLADLGSIIGTERLTVLDGTD